MIAFPQAIDRVQIVPTIGLAEPFRKPQVNLPGRRYE